MSSLRELLKVVPQSPIHHPEGNVFKHSRYVRQCLQEAHSMLVNANLTCFDKIDFKLTDKDVNLLRIGAWMHDIGKISATTLNIDNRHIPFHIDLISCAELGRWQAIDHELPRHYKPMMRKLGEPWRQIWQASPLKDRKDLFFMINHHMALRGEGFSKRLSKRLIDEDGCYHNTRGIKLLVILIMMDRLGRSIKFRIEEAFETLDAFQICATERTKPEKPASLPAPNDPLEFVQLLKNKPIAVIKQAFQGKFGRQPTEQELAI